MYIFNLAHNQAGVDVLNLVDGFGASSFPKHERYWQNFAVVRGTVCKPHLAAFTIRNRFFFQVTVVLPSTHDHSIDMIFWC